MEIKRVFDFNEQWVKEKLDEDPEYFHKLSLGQNPECLFLGCSDSRIVVDNLMISKLGNVFVHRNIANLAPNNDFNFISVLNYAVNYLKVKHIVVCGHYKCGGIAAAVSNEDYGALNPWLRNVCDVYRFHKHELDRIENEEARLERLVQLNVEEQCLNIAKTVDVQRAYKTREIYIHGWVFDVNTGHLIDLHIDLHQIMQNMEKIDKLE